MKALKRIPIETILFYDIETAPQWQTFEDAPENVQKEWIYKFKFRSDAPTYITTGDPIKDDESLSAYVGYYSTLWLNMASLYAEFSRVVALSVGVAYEGTFRVKTFAHNNEGRLLRAFANSLNGFAGSVPVVRFCGHYIKGFDHPFLSKRLLINRVAIPASLDTSDLKPWEMPLIDTQELWKFGMGQSATLPSVAMAFGLPTPKDDIDGSQVAAAWFNGEIERIATYCAKDVLTVFNIFKCLRGEEPYSEEKVTYVSAEYED
jgi:hypothetical protein